LVERPESWLNLLWISLETLASSGFFAQPNPMPRTIARTKEETNREFLFMLDSRGERADSPEHATQTTV
jgi:hypothetical protein